MNQCSEIERAHVTVISTLRWTVLTVVSPQYDL